MVVLEQFVKSDPLALRWSIQSGVSDGCLELFSKAYAPVDHIEVAMVLLRIRADHLCVELSVQFHSQPPRQCAHHGSVPTN